MTTIGSGIRIREAAERLQGAVRRTPLEAFACPDERIELRVKLECLQETGSFKARGAWNNLSLLSEEQRAAGVVATSSGNHGQALAWAAARAGVKATIVMPANAYPNKIQACRDHGAEVVLGTDRPDAERICAERVAAGATLVHPYDAERTIQGAGTVGLEVAEDWPEVEVVVVPVGGGGMLTGCALALRQELGDGVAVLGAEPAGAPTMSRALAAGRPVDIDPITTEVQGLCPLNAGSLNTELCQGLVDDVLTLADAQIFANQRELVLAGGWIVEPAGAAAVALVREGLLPAALLEGRDARNPLRVAAVVSGGNPDPDQLRALREGGG
jgi:threonine dehydratase